MATIAEYLDLADAAYHGNPTNFSARWQIMRWKKGTWYGDGFQGGVFEDDKELVVAFAGTKGNLMTAPISQNSANARIGVFVIPNMAGAAKALVDWAEQNRGEKPVSIVGHSLGGALAQVVGAWSGLPFISLNGPGMAAHLKLSAFNVFKPRQLARSVNARRAGPPVGLCLNVKGDFVGSYGHKHIGEVKELTLETAERAHSIDAIRDALPQEDLTKQPWQLATWWPIQHSKAPALGAVAGYGSSLAELVLQHKVFQADRSAGGSGDTTTGSARPQSVTGSKSTGAFPKIEQDYDRLITKNERIGAKWIALSTWLASVTGATFDPPDSLGGAQPGPVAVHTDADRPVNLLPRPPASGSDEPAAVRRSESRPLPSE
jgi:hypothetical protein